MNRIYDCNARQDKVLVRLGDNVSRMEVRTGNSARRGSGAGVKRR